MHGVMYVIFSIKSVWYSIKSFLDKKKVTPLTHSYDFNN